MNTKGFPYPHVSDHAVLRYLERICAVDTEAVRLLIGEACARHQGAPAARIEGARFLLRDNTVITTVTDHGVPHHETLTKLQRGER